MTVKVYLFIYLLQFKLTNTIAKARTVFNPVYVLLWLYESSEGASVFKLRREFLRLW